MARGSQTWSPCFRSPLFFFSRSHDFERFCWSFQHVSRLLTSRMLRSTRESKLAASTLTHLLRRGRRSHEEKKHTLHVMAFVLGSNLSKAKGSWMIIRAYCTGQSKHDMAKSSMRAASLKALPVQHSICACDDRGQRRRRRSRTTAWFGCAFRSVC